MVADVLKVEPKCFTGHSLVNKADKALHNPDTYDLLCRVVVKLGGDLELHLGKQLRRLSCDSYFPKPWDFVLEVDEVQHFTAERAKSLEIYPFAEYGFDVSRYKFLCAKFSSEAGKKYAHKKAVEFPYRGGRIAQRAMLDSFRDLLVKSPGVELGGIIRIDEFMVGNALDESTTNPIGSRDAVAEVLLEQFRLGGLHDQFDRLSSRG
jgi:hypothetical protein